MKNRELRYALSISWQLPQPFWMITQRWRYEPEVESPLSNTGINYLVTYCGYFQDVPSPSQTRSLCSEVLFSWSQSSWSTALAKSPSRRWILMLNINFCIYSNLQPAAGSQWPISGSNAPVLPLTSHWRIICLLSIIKPSSLGLSGFPAIDSFWINSHKHQFPSKKFHTRSSQNWPAGMFGL